MGLPKVPEVSKDPHRACFNRVVSSKRKLSPHQREGLLGRVDAWGLTSFDDFVKKMKQKIVVTRVPRGAKISCFPVFQGIVGADFTNYVLEDEFLKEILDVMAQLRGRPTSWSKCSIAWKNWEAFRTYQAQQELKMAYFAVPTHVREFILGDTPTKDGPIINALKKVYREDEREPMMVSRRMTGG